MTGANRQTIATSATTAAPLQILLYTLPLWGASLGMTLFMPITGIITSVVIAYCLLILPFKARRGPCPNCQAIKTLPFSGFGNRCRRCGEELVLRNGEFHLLEPGDKAPRPGSGRSSPGRSGSERSNSV